MSSHSHLSLLDNFVCIAERCPDNCCHGWAIPVDEKTHQRWNSLEEGALKQTLQASIKAVPGAAGSSYVLQQDAQRSCAHLQQDGMCLVQQQLGHEALPQTCREYPRVTVGSERLRTDSANLSCPEMVRLMIQKKNFKTLFSSAVVAAPDSNALDKVIVALDKLTTVALPMNVVRSGITLFYLTSTVLELMGNVQQGSLSSSVLKKIAKANSKSVSKQLKILEQIYQAGELQSSDQAGILFWSFVGRLAGCNALQELRALLDKHGLAGLYGKQNEAAQYASYLKLKAFIGGQRSQPVLHKWQSALRSYLIIKLRNHGFPYAPLEGNFLVNILDCSVSLAAIQLWMWLLIKDNGAISETELVAIIYKVERAFIHNNAFFQQLDANPQMLDMSVYLGCLADLG